MTADVSAVWAEMGSKAGLSEHFTVAVAALPHPKYQADQYTVAVEALKARISGAAPEPLPLSGNIGCYR